MMREERVLCFVVLQDFIPPSRWCIESLRLILNTGNCWSEVARNTFQYLLGADSTVRDKGFFEENPSEEWLLAPPAALGRRGRGAQQG
jgi:hypothetical protein